MVNNLLETFVEVVDCGSFTKAAERLYLSSYRRHEANERAGATAEAKAPHAHVHRRANDRRRRDHLSGREIHARLRAENHHQRESCSRRAGDDLLRGNVAPKSRKGFHGFVVSGEP